MPTSPGDVDREFDRVDLDNDGVITRQEFHAAYSGAEQPGGDECHVSWCTHVCKGEVDNACSLGPCGNRVQHPVEVMLAWTAVPL